MTRRLRGWNRAAAIVVGTMVTTIGLAGIAWWHGELERWWPATPTALDISDLHPRLDAWWPWVWLGVGIIVSALGVCWLLAHARTSRLRSIRLPGSGPRGTLTLTTSAAVDQLGTLICKLPRVTGFRGRLLDERSTPVLAATVDVTSDADLVALADALTALTAEFATATSIPHLGVRIRIRVVRRRGRPRRIVE